MLDGVDITDVPTDFSKHESGRLEFEFTQHPARFAGTVTDTQGRTVAGASVLAFPADRQLWKEWAATLYSTEADAQGQFRFVALPGQYLLRALHPDAFTSKGEALQQLERLAPGAERADLRPRELKTLSLRTDSTGGPRVR